MNTPRTPLSQPEVALPASELDPTEVAAAARKRELIYAAVGLVVGLFVLPCLIYFVGVLTLGPYAGGRSLWVFLGEFYNNMAHGALRTWFIALSPYLAFWVVRLCFRRTGFGGGNTPAESSDTLTPAQPAQASKRREPFISP